VNVPAISRPVPPVFASATFPTARRALATAELNVAANYYLPTKIKMPVMSARTPITIAPMPT
jgi:hypothetical protein